MVLIGRVEKGVVVFQNGTDPPPDGTLVAVTLMRHEGGAPSVPPAMEPPAKVLQPSIGELERAVATGRVSKERQQALLQLIGMCKTKQPLSDDEVKRILDEERMKKYG